MMNPPDNEVTRLLEAWSDGNQEALDELMPLVYAELRKMAQRFMNKQSSGHTLQTTALIHEAYLKLANQKDQRWQNRAHFFAVAAQAMRHILVDHARTRQREKRGGKTRIISLDQVAEISDERSAEIIALDEALQALEKLDERKSRVVELRYFAGLNEEEIAEVLKVSQPTVQRDWRFAKGWLFRELSSQ